MMISEENRKKNYITNMVFLGRQEFEDRISDKIELDKIREERKLRIDAQRLKVVLMGDVHKMGEV